MFMNELPIILRTIVQYVHREFITTRPLSPPGKSDHAPQSHVHAAAGAAELAAGAPEALPAGVPKEVAQV